MTTRQWHEAQELTTILIELPEGIDEQLQTSDILPGNIEQHDSELTKYIPFYNGGKITAITTSKGHAEKIIKKLKGFTKREYYNSRY